MPTTRPLLGVQRTTSQPVAAGLSIAKIQASVLGWDLDPFIQADWFRMSEPFFPPHPHAGFSAVTFMLPQSPGGFINRDSLGQCNLIPPGALHWAEAARGLMHEEVPIERGVECEGLQIFVNLPAALKLEAPAVYHVEREDAPLVAGAGSQVRCYVGDFATTKAAAKPRTECALWDLRLEPGASVVLPLPKDWTATVVVAQGAIQTADGPARSGSVIGYGRGDDLLVSAGAAGAYCVLLAGRPLGEPLVSGGPFVMSTREQLLDAKQRFAAGDMGSLTASF